MSVRRSAFEWREGTEPSINNVDISQFEVTTSAEGMQRIGIVIRYASIIILVRIDCAVV